MSSLARSWCVPDLPYRQVARFANSAWGTDFLSVKSATVRSMRPSTFMLAAGPSALTLLPAGSTWLVPAGGHQCLSAQLQHTDRTMVGFGLVVATRLTKSASGRRISEMPQRFSSDSAPPMTTNCSTDFV